MNWGRDTSDFLTKPLLSDVDVGGLRINTATPPAVPVMTPFPDFPSGCVYLVEFADLGRSQVVYTLGPMSFDQAAQDAEVALLQDYGETPAAGERVRVSGPYLVDQGQSRQFTVASPQEVEDRNIP